MTISFGSNIAPTARKGIETSDVNVVLNLFIQCNETIIRSYLTSILPDVNIYTELEAKMIAKYSKRGL